MDAETTKRWRSTEAVLERARLALPLPEREAQVEFDLAISEYQEFLSHNELGLAFDALRDAAELVASRGSVWKDLIRAAEFMELRDRIPELEKRFVASTSLAGSEKSAKRRLTPRWSGRVEDKVPSPNAGARAAQLNR